MQKRLLAVKELSEYINIPVETIDSWTCQKRIPHVKVGRLLRFDITVIDEWLKEGKVEVAKWWKE